MAAFALAAAALFAVYLRLSRTLPENSDMANILLAASDMLHGNLLLHGWYLTDVSFYTTEVPQYALLEIFFGVHANTAHIAAAMTYTLVVVLAVLLARGGFTSRAAVTRMLITAGILLAPQLGTGVRPLILTIGHIGTAVPILLIWLLLDRAPQRWWVPVLTGLGLAWVLVADQIVLIVGVVPLAVVCALRIAEAAIRERSLSRGVAARKYELSLIAAAGVAAGLAWVAERVLRSLGGYIVAPVPFTFTLQHFVGNLHSLWAVPQIFGADYRGLSGGPFYTALLHMISLALVGLRPAPGGLAVLRRHLPGGPGPGRSHRGKHRAVRGDQRGLRGPARDRRGRAVRGSAGGPDADGSGPPASGPGASREHARPPCASRRVRGGRGGAARVPGRSRARGDPARRTARLTDRSRPGCRRITCGTAWAATGRAASSRSRPTARSRSGRC